MVSGTIGKSYNGFLLVKANIEDISGKTMVAVGRILNTQCAVAAFKEYGPARKHFVSTYPVRFASKSCEVFSKIVENPEGIRG